ncbi:MAG: hypothetical protein ABSD80_10930 [Caulobacteraceae bacterium]
MAPPKPIPDSSDLLRYVKGKLLAKDPDTDDPVGFTPFAFELRDGEDHLSAAWPQFFDGTRDQVVDLAIHDVGQFVEIKANDRFALGVVGEIKTACADYGVHVRVVHDGEGYRSHAAVRRYGNATLELQERLASVAWAEMIKPTKAVVVASKRARKARD